MNDIVRVTNIIDWIVYAIMAIIVIVGGGYVYLKKKGYFRKKKRNEEDYTDSKYADIREFFSIDDIKEDMIITDGHRRFIAGVKTSGVNYFNGTMRERGRIINSHIENVNTIDNPQKLFVQATEDNIEPYIEEFEKNRDRYLKQAGDLKVEVQQLYRTLEEVKVDDMKAKEMVVAEIQKKEKMLDNIDWIVRRNETKEHYVKATASTEKRDKYESYVIAEYFHDDLAFGVDLEKEEIFQKAIKDLDIKIKAITRGYARSGVECTRLTGLECAQLLRTTFNPLDGDVYKVEQLLNSDMYVYAATADNEKTVNMKAVLEELEGTEGESHAV